MLVAGGLAQSPRLQALLDGFPTMEPAPEERFLERVFALGAARCAVLLAGLYPGLEFAPRHTPAFGLRLRDDTFDRVIPENAPVGFTGRRLYSLPAGEAYVLHLEVCQGFSARYLPRKGNHWRRFELTPPPTLTPGGAVDWKIEVEMTRLPDKIAVQVRNHTGGPATLAGAFEVPLE